MEDSCVSVSSGWTDSSRVVRSAMSSSSSSGLEALGLGSGSVGVSAVTAAAAVY